MSETQKPVLTTIIVIVVVVAAGFALWRSVADTDTPALPGGATGDLSLNALAAVEVTNLQGEAVSLADYAGTPLVINAWASWCPFCIDELPAFVEAQRQLGEDVVVIAIDRGESADIAEEYLERVGDRGDVVWLLDPSDSFYGTIGGFSMPETLFIDSDGSLVFHKRVPMNLEEIMQRSSSLN